MAEKDDLNVSREIIKKEVQKVPYDWDFIAYLEDKFSKKIDKKLREYRKMEKESFNGLDDKKDVSRETIQEKNNKPYFFLTIGIVLIVFGVIFGKITNKK